MTHPSSDRLYLYESPIDAMSAASIENAQKGDINAWKRRCRLSLAGTSDIALSKHLHIYPHTKELVFCLDNDPPGRKASKALSVKYAEKGYHTRIELPVEKDYNVDLLCMFKQMQLGRT